MKIRSLLTVPALLLTLLAGLAFGPPPARAATANFSESVTGVQTIPIVFDRTVSAVSTPVIARIKFPFKAEVLSVTASCETSDLASTDEVYTIDVLEAGTSILSSGIVLAAADTVYQGTLADTSIADEAVVTVTLDVAGTTPSITDVTVLLTVRRTN